MKLGIVAMEEEEEGRSKKDEESKIKKRGQNVGPPYPFLFELLSQLRFDRVDLVKLELTHQKKKKTKNGV